MSSYLPSRFFGRIFSGQPQINFEDYRDYDKRANLPTMASFDIEDLESQRESILRQDPLAIDDPEFFNSAEMLDAYGVQGAMLMSYLQPRPFNGDGMRMLEFLYRNLQVERIGNRRNSFHVTAIISEDTDESVIEDDVVFIYNSHVNVDEIRAQAIFILDSDVKAEYIEGENHLCICSKNIEADQIRSDNLFMAVDRADIDQIDCPLDGCTVISQRDIKDRRDVFNTDDKSYDPEDFTAGLEDVLDMLGRVTRVRTPRKGIRLLSYGLGSRRSRDRGRDYDRRDEDRYGRHGRRSYDDDGRRDRRDHRDRRDDDRRSSGRGRDRRDDGIYDAVYGVLNRMGLGSLMPAPARGGFFNRRGNVVNTTATPVQPQRPAGAPTIGRPAQPQQQTQLLGQIYKGGTPLSQDEVNVLNGLNANELTSVLSQIISVPQGTVRKDMLIMLNTLISTSPDALRFAFDNFTKQVAAGQQAQGTAPNGARVNAAPQNNGQVTP